MTVLLDDALSEAELCLLAECLSLKLRKGDIVALHGDLGAGKTTFARALVRAVVGDPSADVPSPTFSLAQSYSTQRLRLTHFDFYRLNSAAETEEVGFDEAITRGAAIVEWPERAGDLIVGDTIGLRLASTTEPDTRQVSLTATGAAVDRAARVVAIFCFLRRHASGGAHVTYMQGDTSFRGYARVHDCARTAVLMDAPRMPNGGVVRDGRTYSDISKLAEDVRPFVAIAGGLRSVGLSAPEIYAADLQQGLLLTEDLGPRVFGKEMQTETGQEQLWREAVDALLHLAHHGLPTLMPLPDETHYSLPRRDRAAFEIEIDVLLDWYWPLSKGAPASETTRREFHAVWAPVIDRLLALPAGVFLRDYISPNLVWLPDRSGIRRVGILDFQDAQSEHWAFDLVSLLQDARVSVPRALETKLFEHYCQGALERDRAFDEVAFTAAYADFGAQRNTRIVGLWARMLKRDHQPAYLRFCRRHGTIWNVTSSIPHSAT